MIVLPFFVEVSKGCFAVFPVHMAEDGQRRDCVGHVHRIPVMRVDALRIVLTACGSEHCQGSVAQRAFARISGFRRVGPGNFICGVKVKQFTVHTVCDFAPEPVPSQVNRIRIDVLPDVACNIRLTRHLQDFSAVCGFECFITQPGGQGGGESARRGGFGSVPELFRGCGQYTQGETLSRLPAIELIAVIRHQEFKIALRQVGSQLDRR